MSKSGCRAAKYLGLAHPPDCEPRSHWARVFDPRGDSTRSELKLTVGLSLALIAVFAAGAVTQHWLWRIGTGVVILLVYVPLLLRSVRYLRHSI
jgi:hypothetical protein